MRRTRVIFNPKLAKTLISKGFNVIDIEVDKEGGGVNAFIFEENLELEHIMRGHMPSK